MRIEPLGNEEYSAVICRRLVRSKQSHPQGGGKHNYSHPSLSSNQQNYLFFGNTHLFSVNTLHRGQKVKHWEILHLGKGRLLFLIHIEEIGSTSQSFATFAHSNPSRGVSLQS